MDELYSDEEVKVRAENPLTPNDAEIQHMFYDSDAENVDSDSDSDAVEVESVESEAVKAVESEATDSDSDESKHSDQPIIDNIYKSMSQIVSSLNSDNLLLNIQAKKIHDEMEFILKTISELKVENVRRSSTDNNLITVVNDLKSKVENPSIVKFDDLQKQIIDTRSLLLQTITTNISSIKHELESRKTNDIRPQVKAVVADEVKIYMSNMPTLDKKFNEFAREQRASLSQHIRKSTVRRMSRMKTESSSLLMAVRDQIASTDKSKELAKLRKKHDEFVLKTHRTIEALTIRIAQLEQ